MSAANRVRPVSVVRYERSPRPFRRRDFHQFWRCTWPCLVPSGSEWSGRRRTDRIKSREITSNSSEQEDRLPRVFVGGERTATRQTFVSCPCPNNIWRMAPLRHKRPFTTDKVCLLSLPVIELTPLCRNLVSQRIDFIRKTTLAGDHNNRARKVDLHSSNSSRKSFIRSKGFALRLPI
jgi:hypothetical protein